MQNTAPNRRQFAIPFQTLSRISFWLHIVMGIISGGMLAIAILSREFNEQVLNPIISIGIIFAIGALIALGVRIYWAYRYTRLAKQLQCDKNEPHPRRQDVVKALQIGLAVSIGGIVLAFLASEATAIASLGKALAQPHEMVIHSPQSMIRSLDLVLILADINILGAHLLGGVNSMGLLYWVTD